MQHRGQKSEYLGPDDGNLDSDFFYQLLVELGTYDEVIRPEMDAMFEGYARGFNRYLTDTGVENVTDPNCQGAQWVMPMTSSDVRRIHLTPIFLPNFARFIVASVPPTVVAKGTGDEQVQAVDVSMERERQQQLAAQDKQASPAVAAIAAASVNPEDKGSNGVAIGGKLSESGRGMLFSNPHISWNKEFSEDFGIRLYGMHQVIPGLFST